MSKEETWIPPKIWEGTTVFIVAGGPSVSLSPLHLIKDRKVLAANDAFRNPDGSIAEWVDACYFGDCKWWMWNKFDEPMDNGGIKKGLTKFCGLKMTTCQRLYHIKQIKTFKRGKPKGIETTPGLISWNGNTGLSAINVAYHLGSRRIVLIGFDMGPMNITEGDEKKEKVHWHNFHKRSTGTGVFNRYLQNIPAIANDAKNLGVELINATEHTYINPLLIKRKRLEDCL